MSYLNSKVLEAFEFAAKAHHGQMRKYPGDIPYISHPLAVALILSRAGFGDEVVMAGALHDVVEDTPVTPDDIKNRFGERVSELVMGVTEDKSLSWPERKHSYNQKIKESNSEVKAISAGDLIANRQSLLRELRKGINTWGDETYVHDALQIDAERFVAIKSGLDHPLVAELEQLLQETELLVQPFLQND